MLQHKLILRLQDPPLPQQNRPPSLHHPPNHQLPLLQSHIKHVSELRNYFKDQILARIPEVEINGSMKHRLPGNINLIFNYIEGESLLLLMDAKGICASTGSACSSASLTPSHVLKALKLPYEKIHSSIRFTIGDFTTKEDLDYAIEEIVQIVEKLRSISPIYKKTKG
jgi:cysteine desulfurase